MVVIHCIKGAILHDGITKERIIRSGKKSMLSNFLAHHSRHRYQTKESNDQKVIFHHRIEYIIIPPKTEAAKQLHRLAAVPCYQ